ncbi:hypothetical protein J14TS2_52500 [Bacillus sp. J14TS2]|uniref:hypothetical protein n=1 Tax=Bacillus sp. J14TS2 TaxID=2807188 RepID=UPI001B2DDAEB|nr:hypothetical protein [Bacillus sp. J14TS2]GIN74775.1 hypothetical protein J14TS2_52500 [Bacillus sp. J14TS2]
MKNIVNFFIFIITACILLGTLFLVNGGLSQEALLFVGIILIIMLAAILAVSKLYPAHKIWLCLGICVIILILFVPCFTTLNNLQAPLESAVFKQFLLMFVLIPILFIGSVILAYRHYFIRDR